MAGQAVLVIRPGQGLCRGPAVWGDAREQSEIRRSASFNATNRQYLNYG